MTTATAQTVAPAATPNTVGSARRWRVLAIAATVSAAFFAALLVSGVGRSTPPAPVIPHCEGCGYEVTTFYPDHNFRTINYFSTGGQAVTKEGRWVAPK